MHRDKGTIKAGEKPERPRGLSGNGDLTLHGATGWLCLIALFPQAEIQNLILGGVRGEEQERIHPY